MTPSRLLVCRFKREMPVAVDADHHAPVQTEATARQDGEADEEAGSNPKRHCRRFMVSLRGVPVKNGKVTPASAGATPSRRRAAARHARMPCRVVMFLIVASTVVISTRKPFNCLVEGLSVSDSGEGEIRTPATLAGRPVFETGAFSRSATSPERGKH